MINHIGQSESGNQCDVFLGLYKLRISLLDVTTPLKDCRSTKTERRFFRPEELSNLATTTRELLHKAFHRVFFRRYTDREIMNSCSYAFEMQLLLHPNFKNPDGALKKVILVSNLQAGASQQVADRHFIKVRRKIIDGVRRIMEAVDTQPTSPGIVAPPPVAVFSEDLMELFAETANEVVPPPVDTHTAMHEQRIDEELDRWLSTPTSLNVMRPGEFEPVLSFWKRQHDQGNFRLLSLVARVLFSMPSSSAQIERDFGTAGRMVTPQRSSLSPYNVDMATFLNCNRDYVDITQCPKLSTNAAGERLPSNVLVNMIQDLDDEFGSLENMFSAASMDLGLSDNEEATEG